MRNLGAAVCVLIALAAPVAAQSTSGYVFVALGGATVSARTEATLQAGAGFEVALPKGFGAGAEVGALGPLRSWGESTVGFFSPGGYYHFLRKRDRRLDPFVGAGYTMFFRDGHANLFHFGATSERASSCGIKYLRATARSITGASGWAWHSVNLRPLGLSEALTPLDFTGNLPLNIERLVTNACRIPGNGARKLNICRGRGYIDA